RPRLRLGRVVPGDRATRDDPTVAVERADRGLQRLAANVVEVDVDPVRRELAKCLPRTSLVVVEGLVEPELLEPGELRGAPGAADHACASPTGELSREAPDRARRARDEHRLALLHAADVVDPDERRQPRH